MSVVIVDDERVIVDGFVKLVHWDRIGCEVVAVAHDGIMAMNLITELQPDIVVIDINMPLLSGLEVIKRVSANCPNTVFIIISGYDEFQYMREALRLKVFDYLLKPVDFAQFEELIEKVRRAGLDKREQGAAGADVPLINGIVAHINENLTENITLASVANRFFMNPNYLSEYFKKKTGTNFNAYVNAIRMDLAKQLLETTDMPISEIAQATGCVDYRTFDKKFHKYAGMPPTEYRKMGNNLKK